MTNTLPDFCTKLSESIAQLSLCLVALLCGTWATAHARAQSVPTAVRSIALNAYAGGGLGATDYGKGGTAVMVGAALTRNFHAFEASLDVRYNYVSGDAVVEKSFAGGPKIERRYGRYHPYGEFLLGYGTITFDQPRMLVGLPPYSHDDSKLYIPAGGIEVDLTRSIALKGDFQYQLWHLGKGVDLTPTIATLGLTFRVPYRVLKPHF